MGPPSDLWQEGESTVGEGIYRRLAEHLDRLPGGFAPTDDGADLRLLEVLFTPEEAELAVCLTLDADDAGTIAGRAGRPVAEVADRLAEMSRRGLILPLSRDDGTALYQAAPWVVGIWEFQVNRMTPELLRAADDYFGAPKPQRLTPDAGGLKIAHASGQVRTIPVGKSIDARLPVLPYEQIGRLIESHDRYVVASCICRRHARLSGGGKGCEAPEESCLVFGDWADYYARTGRGRYIDRAELDDILVRANAKGLVLQPTNARDVKFVCCCCKCCCGVLDGIRRQPKPAEAVASSFIAAFDAEACSGCEACLDRCPMGALMPAQEGVSFDADRCIGCGLCTTTCPTGALRLRRKPDAEQAPVPATIYATWHRLADAQAR